MSLDVRPGKSFPLGATVRHGGVNFSVFSKNATGVELALFDAAVDPRPSRLVTFDPRKNRTGHYWHAFLPELKPGQVYAYRVQGPFEPAKGHLFDPKKMLLDPYGRAVIVPASYSRAAALEPGDNAAAAMRSVVADPRGYDWEGDAPLRRPFSQTVIYEMHVRGFTRHPNSGVSPERRGTYAGLIEKVPYLKDLGITAVELLPIFQFDLGDCPRGLANYWGYSPVSFFAPHRAYSLRQDPLGPLDEFRDLVKALHRAGIEVILDVVFNHTAEGGDGGPTLCFRGFENGAYYILDESSGRHVNYTGTGNTLNANHPIVRRMILDSLHYWVEEMHVDGFRFDLAAILSRDESGAPLERPPVLWDIDSDPVLAGTKLIAEAWDAAGLYQVGSFIGDSWKEWNGKFRDDVRSFLKSDSGTVTRVCYRIFGSPDLYEHEGREAEQSINFVTCHDGFTLNDLVSYNEKHNEANGEGNRDGNDNNLSWNCGVEGPTDDSAIEKLRDRQAKNLLAVTLLSIGTPMLLMGDEVRRTQRGNNNAYCQDNEVSWFDWGLLEKHRDILGFVKTLATSRAMTDTTCEDFDKTLSEVLREARIQLHGVRLNQPDLGADSHSIAFTTQSPQGRLTFHMILNAYWEPLEFELPAIPPGSPHVWQRRLDTALDPPDDVCAWSLAPAIQGLSYRAQPRSIVLLFHFNAGI